MRVGTQHNSSVVVLNAWHHRVDGLTSLVALAGIGGAMVGFPLADPIAGLLVAGMIVRLGLQSGVDSFRDLTDRQVDGATRAELEALLAQQRGDGVQSYHKLRLRRTGARWVCCSAHACLQIRCVNHLRFYCSCNQLHRVTHTLSFPFLPFSIHRSIVADVHIVVDPVLSVSAAHQIAERVRLRVRRAMPAVADLLVHIGALHLTCLCTQHVAFFLSKRQEWKLH